MKKLVIFYSLDGNTRLVAETLANIAGADIMELVPKKTVPKGFMKYVIGGYQVIFKINPELMPLSKNVDDYDMLFVCSPVWAGNFTPAFRTFFNTVNVSGKKIALFCCYAGSKGKVFEGFRRELTSNTLVGEVEFQDPVKNGKNYVINRIREWIKEIKI